MVDSARNWRWPRQPGNARRSWGCWRRWPAGSRRTRRRFAQLALLGTGAVDVEVELEVFDGLQRLKWFCWHGNVFRALQTVEDLEFDLDVDGAGPEQRKLCKAAASSPATCGPTPPASPNYGERYRAGEVISSSSPSPP